ncbi:MAG: VWA domain-containing protein, partial [Clostridia bacterium]|nr:VWA domain-containing protein [Clostridia bacterium]
MKRSIKLKKTSAFLIAMVMLLCAVLPMMISDTAKAEPVVYTKDTDPFTFNSWQRVFGESWTDSSYTGTIWTDKSVFTDGTALDEALGYDIGINMEDQDFLVALSAMSSNKSITGYTHIPTDTMLVLDVSGSMKNSQSADELVDATNSAIRQLQAVNEHNRVGVVLYSGNTSLGNSNTGTATVLLPLDRYTQTDNRGNVIHNYLAVNNDGNYVSVGSNVKNANGDTIRQNGKNVAGGTYIQNGIYQAMDQMLDADPIIQDGPQRGTTRIPIMVLMSDGAPTAGNSVYAGNAQGNMGTSNMGNGTETTEGEYGNKDLTEIAFVTQLTAAYAQERIDDHYAATTPLFYTLGLGINASNTNAMSVLNPKNSSDTINTYWNS